MGDMLLDARARAASPATPPAELLALARRFPDEVLSNPGVEALARRDAAAWAELTHTARWYQLDREIRPGLARLGGVAQRCYLADCAERVLPVYERRHPDSWPLRNAVLLARRDAGALDPPAALERAAEAAR